MIPVDEAQEIVVQNANPLAPRSMPLLDAEGLVLAEGVVSDMDMPPFDKSAMDGYAVIAEDTTNVPVELKVVEDIPAGKADLKPVTRGQAAKIMTGAPVPSGADAIIIVENTEKGSAPNCARILASAKKGDNICWRGEDMKKGRIILDRGSVLRPQETGVLASVGCVKPTVYPRPEVGVLSTGDEIVEASETPQSGQIRDSNSYSIASQVTEAGGVCEQLGIARDAEGELEAKIELGLEKDILILSGGVSMGEYDLVPGILKQQGVELFFEKVLIKPGKPTVFGKRDDTLVFGLPGNPVSTFTSFEVFVKPAMLKMMGFAEFRRPKVEAVLSADFKRKKGGRRQYVPCQAVRCEEGWRVSPVSFHGSADLLSITRANSAMIIREDVKEVGAGDIVEIIVFGAYGYEA